MAAAKRIFMLLLILATRWAEGQPRTYNVRDFHASGDGQTDDAKAFVTTWEAACNDSSQPVMLVPAGGTFLLTKAKFEGPCKSPITVQLDGKILAPDQSRASPDDNIVTFFKVDNLTVDGNGVIDGQGAVWWDCYKKKSCYSRPILLAFSSCDNLVVRSIHLKDSADKHMTLFRCSQVLVSNVLITAPGDSPNTDGITMGLSSNVTISNCSIQSGDDCVSMLSNTMDVNITDVTCGPGHGISVGSLGGVGIAQVERVIVSNCSFFDTMNGVRIKTWQGGHGYARDFLFEGLNMTAVQYPIIVDQFYCPEKNCPAKDGGVEISDVRFINIHGTSTDPEAIKLLCSPSVPCQGIYFSDINLSWLNHAAPAKATVLNAHGTAADMVVPPVIF